MKESNEKKKFYYAVLTACLLLIVGVSAVIYNSSIPKPAQEVRITTKSRVTTTTAAPDERANMQATGIPKPTTTKSTASTVPAHEKAYSGDFAAPTDGKTTADFSGGEMVKNSTVGDWRVHNGTDFAAGESDSVYAVQNGTILSVDKDELWGTNLTLLCPDGLKVRYCGLDDSVTLKKGDTVKKGEIIGRIGALPIESADGQHIHVETVINDEEVNPLEALNLL